MKQSAGMRLLVWLIALLMIAIPAYSWGPEGHKVIALIAERNNAFGSINPFHEVGARVNDGDQHAVAEDLG